MTNASRDTRGRSSKRSAAVRGDAVRAQKKAARKKAPQKETAAKLAEQRVSKAAATTRAAPSTRAAPGVSEIQAAIVDRKLTDAARDKWIAATHGVSSTAPTTPMEVLLGEAVLLAMGYQIHNEPRQRRGGSAVPGFAAVAAASTLDEHTGHQLLELVMAIGAVNAEYNFAKQSLGDSPMVRAKEVMREIRAALEFTFDDGEHTVADAQLRKVSDAHPRPGSHAAMAVALEAFASLASEHKEALKRVVAFDVAMIDEALSLAAALRVRSTEARHAGTFSGSDDLIALRNGLLNLLVERMQRIRRAGRYLFRDHPDIARQFTSEYERTRRRENRRKKRGGESKQ